MRGNADRFPQTRGVADADVAATFAGSKSRPPHHVTVDIPKVDELYFQGTSTGSTAGRSGGTGIRIPTNNVDVAVLGQDSINALDDALEEIFPFQNIEEYLLSFPADDSLPVPDDGMWREVEDGGFETDSCLGSTQRNGQHVGPSGTMESPSSIGFNGLDPHADVTKAQSKAGKQGKQKGHKYERQQRYRERKKNREEEVEKSLRQCLKNVEELKRENEGIRWKNESLLMMHSYLDELVSQVGQEQKSCQDDPNLNRGEDMLEIESSYVSCLISNLGLSKSQIEEFNTVWMQFIASWNKEVALHNSLIKNVKQRMVWSSTYERGIHAGVGASLELRNVLNMVGDSSKNRSMLILRLSNQMHTLMSPVQIARVNAFYPGHTPNWVSVASQIQREYTNNV